MPFGVYFFFLLELQFSFFKFLQPSVISTTLLYMKKVRDFYELSD